MAVSVYRRCQYCGETDNRQHMKQVGYGPDGRELYVHYDEVDEYDRGVPDELDFGRGSLDDGTPII